VDRLCSGRVANDPGTVAVQVRGRAVEYGGHAIRAEVLPGAPVEELLAARRARIAELPVAPAPPSDDDPLATAQRENEAVPAYQAERGVLAEEDGGYGYTGRGALRSVHRIANAMSKK
jgi:hypothetical protein